MTCAEFHQVAGALALGALDPDELPAALEHLAQSRHEGCPEALARGRRTAAALAQALAPERPDPAIWEAIAARGRHPDGPAARRARRAAASLMAVACVAGLGLLLWAHERSLRRHQDVELAALRADATADVEARADLLAHQKDLQAAATAARELPAWLEEPGARVLQLAPPAGGPPRAAAVVNLERRHAAVLSTALPPPPPGREYQLWILRRGAPPAPAGFLRFGGGPLGAGALDPALLALPFEGVAVSEEPAGGSAAPGQPLIVGRWSE